jgi:predicted NodU family carbamoyl transferase
MGSVRALGARSILAIRADEDAGDDELEDRSAARPFVPIVPREAHRWFV